MNYAISIKRSAQKSLGKIPPSYKIIIFDKIRSPSENPRPVGGKKLVGRDAWRISVGNYRVICEVYDGELLILVIFIGHRGDVCS